MGDIEMVNEGSTCVIKAAFADENGAPVTPAAGTVRVDNLSAGTVIRASVPFTPTGPEHDIVVTAAENAIANAELSVELHAVTLTFVYGIDAKQGTAQHLFYVRNLLRLG
jgi:hypothetical protein